MNPRFPIAAGLAALTLAAAAAGCGSSDSSKTGTKSSAQTSTDATTSSNSTSTSTQDLPATPKGKAVPVSNATDLAHKPKIAKPSGDPPVTLVSKDFVVGKGPAAKAGDTVSVQYVGKSFSDGKQFDASWDRGAQPFDFPLGAGQVIKGWDQGVIGMKAGGRRELVIPPDLGYGPQGTNGIAGGETLVFVIDVKKITPVAGGG